MLRDGCIRELNGNRKNTIKIKSKKRKKNKTKSLSKCGCELGGTSMMTAEPSAFFTQVIAGAIHNKGHKAVVKSMYLCPFVYWVKFWMG